MHGIALKPVVDGVVNKQARPNSITPHPNTTDLRKVNDLLSGHSSWLH